MVSGLIGAPRVGPLNALFAPLVPKPTAEFLETIRPVEAEGIIPMVMNTAELILEMAKDEKEYGKLQDGSDFLWTEYGLVRVCVFP